MKGARLLVTERVGRSPFTFEAWDRKGKRHLVWFLDHDAIESELPKVMLVEDWQFISRGADLADVALHTGISQ